MKNNILNAKYTGSLVMNFAANSIDNSSISTNNYYYLPQNTIFNCYGTGCYYLDTLDRGSIGNASKLILNINGCGQCDIDTCIYSFDLECSNGIDLYLDYNYMEYICVNNTNDCGCDKLLNNELTFWDDSTDINCYSLPTSHPTLLPTLLPTLSPTLSPTVSFDIDGEDDSDSSQTGGIVAGIIVACFLLV
eukprot:UN05290